MHDSICSYGLVAAVLLVGGCSGHDASTDIRDGPNPPVPVERPSVAEPSSSPPGRASSPDAVGTAHDFDAVDVAAIEAGPEREAAAAPPSENAVPDRIRVVANDPAAIWSFTRTACEYPPDQLPALVVELSDGVRKARFNVSCLAVLRAPEDQQRAGCLCVRHVYFPARLNAACVEARGIAVDRALEGFRKFAGQLRPAIGWPADVDPTVNLVGLYMSQVDLDRLRQLAATEPMASRDALDSAVEVRLPSDWTVDLGHPRAAAAVRSGDVHDAVP